MLKIDQYWCSRYYSIDDLPKLNETEIRYSLIFIYDTYWLNTQIVGKVVAQAAKFGSKM